MSEKWEQRARKVDKRSKGMRVSGRSVFVMRDTMRKRDDRKARGFLRDKKATEANDDQG